MFKLIVWGASVALASSAHACTFTKEQDRLINLAASYGEPFNYQKTLAAIVVQESFVGQYVVRVNPKDGKHGSYGITHIMLDTAMWLEGVQSSWKAKARIAPRLMKDDIYALTLAKKKLDSIHKGDWMATWSKYNGGSKEYANKIKQHIRTLESCGYFDWG